jgi:hypothetical protein
MDARGDYTANIGEQGANVKQLRERERERERESWCGSSMHFLVSTKAFEKVLAQAAILHNIRNGKYSRTHNL